MPETRRVRFTDDYAPGPKGCPVWCIEMQWTFGVPVFIRAESEDEALHIFSEWCEANPGVMDGLMQDEIKAGNHHDEELTWWRHTGADDCWKE